MEIEGYIIIARTRRGQRILKEEESLRNAVTFRWRSGLSYRPAEKARKRVEGGACRHLYEHETYVSGAAPSIQLRSREASWIFSFDEAEAGLKAGGRFEFPGGEESKKAVKETGGKNAQSKSGRRFRSVRAKAILARRKNSSTLSGYNRKSDNRMSCMAAILTKKVG